MANAARHFLLLALSTASLPAVTPDRVKVTGGTIEGTGPQPTGIREFKGVPYAAPPTGDRRWKPPKPVVSWTDVRDAKQFGARCMQRSVFGDMIFRSNGMSEDCLFLNIWTPARSASDSLPVLVYFYGGGFVAGDGSESRYDGESMAQQGIVSLTVNYRLGVFGFFAHPELTAESPHHASGDYTFLDQAAALQWVHDNIAAFGGDPGRVTIAGESAGSVAVSALMASPLSKNLIAGAIGESGSIMGALSAVSRAKAEETGVRFVKSLNTASVSALRAMPTDQIVEAAGKGDAFRFSPNVDGYFFPESPYAIYSTGKQAHVPLLAGWNSEERTGHALLDKGAALTVDNYRRAVTKLYGEHAPEVLNAYSVSSDANTLAAATDLAGDRFIAFSTWKWIDFAGKTGGQPVYRYYYSRPRPTMTPEISNATSEHTPLGAVHSAEIEYAMGNLSGNRVYAWSSDDFAVSKTMQAYFANFVKTGNPNGAGLPNWPATNIGRGVAVMHIDVKTRAETSSVEARYKLLDKLTNKY